MSADSLTLELHVERDGPKSRLMLLWARPPLGAFVIGTGACLRVAIVQSAALLVSGDDVRIRVSVGPGARLELVETASTIAHDVRGRRGQRQRIEARVAEAGQLFVREQPLVLAAGCDLDRAVRLELAAGATALWSEATQLGRDGEDPGRARLGLRVEHAGRPLLHEQLDTCARDVLRSAVVLGGRRTVGAVALFGLRDPSPPGGVLELAGGGFLARATGDGVRVSRLLDPIEARWRQLMSELAGGTAFSERRDLRSDTGQPADTPWRQSDPVTALRSHLE